MTSLKTDIIQVSKVALVGLLFTFGINYLFAAWTGPTTPPPPDPSSTNTAPPINVSTEPQTKKGNLTIQGLDSFNAPYTVGFAVLNGNAGFGIATPQLTSPKNNGSTGNVDVNDVYVRSIGKWVSEVEAQSGGGGGGGSSAVPNPLKIYVPVTGSNANGKYDVYSDLQLWEAGISRGAVKVVTVKYGPTSTTLPSGSYFGYSATINDGLISWATGCCVTYAFEILIGWNLPPAPVLTMEALPNPVLNGQQSTISWSATNADYCTAIPNGDDAGWPGTRTTSGAYTTTPMNSWRNYQMVCYGPGGETPTFTLNINLSATPPPPFSVDVNTFRTGTLADGTTDTISWTSLNETSCTGSVVAGSSPVTSPFTGAKALSGFTNVGKDQIITSGGVEVLTRTFTVSCTGAGPANDSVTLTFAPPSFTWNVLAGTTWTRDDTSNHLAPWTTNIGNVTGSDSVSMWIRKVSSPVSWTQMGGYSNMAQESGTYNVFLPTYDCTGQTGCTYIPPGTYMMHAEWVINGVAGSSDSNVFTVN